MNETVDLDKAKLSAIALTDDQCDEFRRLPLSFNDMVRAIYEAGRKTQMNDDTAFMAEKANEWEDHLLK